MRLTPLLALTSVIAAAAAAGNLAAQPLPDSTAKRVDAVFARFDRPDSPGCALGIFHNGAIAYSRGYGSANLEYGVPITPTTPFISGSVAKQFTAAAIALLVEQGRISLDDDVRKYIPELPDYGAKITIDHLVHHTSGLRDFWALVQVAGMRFDDGYSVGDVIRLAARQKHLNFPPGSEYDYSNTGYIALGLIVQRVTGKSLRDFTAEQIFRPLGMTSTHFHDDHTMLVPGRASAYSPLPEGGYRINVWNNDIVGQGGLIVTVNDLLEWDENFYTGKVGGPGFLKRQLQQGKLTNGTVLSYAFGLTVGQYRGLSLVEHSGSSGGYRTIISRFPTEHASVVALCNTTEANTTTLSHQVADIVLGSKLSAPVQRAARPDSVAIRGTTPAARDLSALAGRYYSNELDATYDVSATAATLMVKRPRGEVDTLQVVGPRTFRAGALTYRFAANVSGKAPGFAVDIGRARGMEFDRVPASRRPAEQNRER
jgi:CubicO group peptidase (beta-lactamase class C family)